MFAVIDPDISRPLIERKVSRGIGNFGLLPQRWFAQLEAIRRLPETEKES